MERIWCENIPTWLGKEISGTFYMEKIAYSENQSTRWQAIKLVDKTGYVFAKAWAEFIRPEYMEMQGCVVRILGKVEVFRDAYEIRLVKMEKLEKGLYNASDFYTSVDGTEFGKLKDELKGYIESVENISYKALLGNIFTENRINSCGRYPAITKHHHNYGGGWLVHTVEVVRIALSICALCKDSPIPGVKVNRDLLIAGALLHDIGVVKFYEDGSDLRAPRMTVRGRRVGHRADALIYISCVNNMLSDDQKIKDLTELLHVVSACHGEEDAVLKEAVILYRANEISKACSAFDDAFLGSDTKTYRGIEQAYSRYFERTLERNVGGEQI